MMTAIDRVHEAFNRIGHPIDERTGMACCPAHADDSASLSIGVGDDGRVLFRCFAGCNTENILQMIGLSWPDIFENDDNDRPQSQGAFGGARRTNSLPPVASVLPTGTEGGGHTAPAPRPAPKPKKPDRTKHTQPDIWYHYYTEDWRYVHSVMKWLPRPPDYPKKEFRQGVCRIRDDGGLVENRSMLAKWNLTDVPRVLYRLPELVQALHAHETWTPPVVWVEGEKDVDVLRENGQVATTSSQGADGFRKLVEGGGLEPLNGADIIVWPDDDEKALTGFSYGAQLIEQLTAAGAHVIAVVRSRRGCKDAADHVAACKADGITDSATMFNEDNLEYIARLGQTGTPSPLEWAEMIDAAVQAETEAKMRAGEQERLALVVPMADVPTPDHITLTGTPNSDGGDGGDGGGDGGGSDGDGAMPGIPRTIRVNGRPSRSILEDFRDVIRANNEPVPQVFQRDGMVTYLHNVDGRPRITPFKKAGMQGYIAEIADCVKQAAKKIEPVNPPGELVDMLLADRAPMWPHLEVVTHMPLVTITRDGMSLRTTRGYHEPTRSWYEPLVDVRDVPHEPTPEDVQYARDQIELLMGGFAFEDAESKANAIGMLFSPLLRNAINAYTPMFVIRAPKQGSGKSTLANLVSLVHTGTAMSPTPFTDNDEELTKSVTSLMNAGDPLIVFDNMERTLRSPVLAGILTSGSLRARRLGYNDQDIKVMDRAVWIATGNNLKVDTDFARRTATIVLNARESRPEFRDFAITDINGWALENRAELIWSMLTLIAHWCANGQEIPGYARTGGINTQYRRWIEVIGGVIEGAEFTEVGPLLANRGVVDSANDEEMDKERMLLGFWDSWNTAEFTFSDILHSLGDQYDPHHRTLQESMPQWLLDKHRKRETKSIQMFLSRIQDAPHGEFGIMLTIRHDSRRRAHYAISFSDPRNTPPPPPGAAKSVLPPAPNSNQNTGPASNNGLDF